MTKADKPLIESVMISKEPEGDVLLILAVVLT
jgi:hypothetical protein